MKLPRLFCCVAGLVLLLFCLQSAYSAVFIIPNGDVTALKNGINTSNTNSADDTIELAANGTYILHSSDPSGTGLPVIGADGGHSLVINGNGSVIQRSTDSGTPQFGIFSIDSGGNLSASGLTIANGMLPLHGCCFTGGGLGNRGRLMLTNCVISNNQAEYGGGIYSAGTGATLVVSNSTVSDNMAGDYDDGFRPGGGGILNSGGNLIIVGCTFSNNSAYEGGGLVNLNFQGSIAVVSNSLFTGNHASGFQGGAISNRSTGGNTIMSVSDSIFNGNSADGSGAAMANSNDIGGASATLSVTRCTLTGNSASGSGGGIRNFSRRPQQNGAAAVAVLIVADSTFASNSGSAGGGIISTQDSGIQHLGSSGLTVINSTFTGNLAYEGGGILLRPDSSQSQTITNCTFAVNSIYNNQYTDPTYDGGAALYVLPVSSGSLTLTNCTLSGNSAPFHGGGLFISGSSGVPAVLLGNTILKAGMSGENIYSLAGTIMSQGYNLTDDNGGGFLTGPADQINTNPMLDSAGLRNNGGPTRTIALLPGSPAINSGDPNAPARDQRYYLRNGAPDKGAFEYGGTISPLSIVSRKTHGAAGTFDVDLPLNGNTGVECRSGGGSGNHQLILTFATPVTIGSASVTTGTGSVSNISISGSQVTLDLTGVANAQQIVLTVSGVNDGANSNYVIIPMRVLLADTTANSTVNASDVSQTKAQVGQAVTSSNFRMDVNLSGTITASDVTAVKSKVGTVIPIP